MFSSLVTFARSAELGRPVRRVTVMRNRRVTYSLARSEDGGTRRRGPRHPEKRSRCGLPRLDANPREVLERGRTQAGNPALARTRTVLASGCRGESSTRPFRWTTASPTARTAPDSSNPCKRRSWTGNSCSNGSAKTPVPKSRVPHPSASRARDTFSELGPHSSRPAPHGIREVRVGGAVGLVATNPVLSTSWVPGRL